MSAAQALRAVLDEERPDQPRDPRHRSEIDTSAEEMRDDDEARALGDRAAQKIVARSQRLEVEIDRHRLQPVSLGDPRHVGMCDGREDHLTSLGQGERLEEKIEARAHRVADDRLSSSGE